MAHMGFLLEDELLENIPMETVGESAVVLHLAERAGHSLPEDQPVTLFSAVVLTPVSS